MSEIIKNVIVSLDRLASSATMQQLISEIHKKQPLNFSTNEFADMANNLLAKLRLVENLAINDSDLQNELMKVPQTIEKFATSGMFVVNDSNPTSAILNYLVFIQWIDSIIDRLFKSIGFYNYFVESKNLLDQAQDAHTKLREIILENKDIEDRIAKINKANERGKNLLETLEKLGDLDEKVKSIEKDIIAKSKKLEDQEKKVLKILQDIPNKEKEIDSLLLKCEETYKIATTIGLAGAFDLRAKSLRWTMGGWILILILSLGTGIYLGNNRFEILNTAVNTNKDIGYIWIQIFLSVLSFGAPIWLAWVATKQINQTFKLSEDYAYKSSVAKTYEGYRREAEKIDSEHYSDLEKQLFASTLQRFDEAPLRYTENQHHNSPLNELLDSKEFKNFLKEAPDYIIDLISKIKGMTITNKPKVSKEEKTEKKED